jgi:hypothetical protein
MRNHRTNRHCRVQTPRFHRASDAHSRASVRPKMDTPTSAMTSRIAVAANRELPRTNAAGGGANRSEVRAPDSWGVEVVVRVRGSWS